MTQKDLGALFESLGVVQNGHFRRKSGRHANRYVQCARLFENAEATEQVCALLAEHFEADRIDVVVSPAIGGVILGYEVGRQLQVRNIFPERKEGALIFARGFKLQKGERVLILEDEVTTGTSVRETIEIVHAMGGIVVGIGCVVDKSGGQVAFDYPFFPLYTAKVDNYSKDKCPLCAAGYPLDN